MLGLRAPVLCLLCFASLLSCAPGFSMAEAEELALAITVLGSAAVSAKPETARIRLGVGTHDPSAARALSENNEIMSKLVAALEEQGIPKKDLHTSSLALSPQHHHDSRGRLPDIVGSNASHVLQVTVRKLEMVGPLLDQVASLGANRIDGVTFSVDDPAMQEDRARQVAMADAHRKAALYADAAGVKLGRVLSVEETPGGVPLPRQHMMRATATAPVEPGEIELRVLVTVTYAIEEG